MDPIHYSWSSIVFHCRDIWSKCSFTYSWSSIVFHCKDILTKCSFAYPWSSIVFHCRAIYWSKCSFSYSWSFNFFIIEIYWSKFGSWYETMTHFKYLWIVRRRAGNLKIYFNLVSKRTETTKVTHILKMNNILLASFNA